MNSLHETNKITKVIFSSMVFKNFLFDIAIYLGHLFRL